MDSPHLLNLTFLLLALAAPHPSIAMSNAGPAKGPQGNATMTIYYCKDYKSCTCKRNTNNFKSFTKIAEIQNKTFPDVIVELEANESHITVCFEQAKSCLEGIYGILWEKDEVPKILCGTLNSGENGGGNISTEEKDVCCEAEIDVWKSDSTLKCYTRKSRRKLTTLPFAISAEGIPGNPEFLTSKKNSTGILLAFLFVGLCTGWATMFYLLRLRRGQASRQDRQASDTEKLTQP